MSYVSRDTRIGRKVNLSEFYPHYKERAKEDLIPYTVSRKIVNLFMKFLGDKILEGNMVKFPENMGTFYVKGKKIAPTVDDEGMIKGVAINFKATRELRARCPECAERKEVIYHFNEHSSGVTYSFFWCKKKMYTENKDLYHFTPARDLKRSLVPLVKAGEIEYEVVEKSFYSRERMARILAKTEKRKSTFA